MSQRKTILTSGEYYHVFNRSVQKFPIFKGQRECDLFLESTGFYLQTKPPTKFSLYRRNRDKYPILLDDKIITLVNYVLIPNHFHFTLFQNKDYGVQKFIQKVTNSFAHYFNIKYKNTGHLFEKNFEAAHIESNEQLIHLSRYIHLNPVTAYLVEKPEDYKYSSYRIYIKEEKSEIVDSSIIMKQFSSVESYKKFVMDQKDYQRKLDKIKHLLHEDTRFVRI